MKMLSRALTRGFFFTCITLSFFFVVSCAPYRSCVSLIDAAGTIHALLSPSRSVRNAVFSLSENQTIVFSLEEDVIISPDTSLLVRYSYTQQAVNTQVAIQVSEFGDKWVLPPSAQWLGDEKMYQTLSYVIPLSDSTLSKLFLSVEDIQNDKAAETQNLKVEGDVSLLSLELVPRFFGFNTSTDSFTASPFVYFSNNQEGYRYEIDIPLDLMPSAELSMELIITDEPVRIDWRGRSTRYELFPEAGFRTIRVPASYASAPESNSAKAVSVSSAQAQSFTLRVNPSDRDALTRSGVRLVAADPALILSWPQEFWQNERYAVFSWDRFPSILVFDTSDYATQSLFFKRLAFYVEKQGYTGILWPLEDLAHLHGFNAHDYRAEDLARFFEHARREQFLLNEEEYLLLDILLQEGILALHPESGEILPKGGAVISISRESSRALRELFLVHEAWHGLFFTDAAFRDFAFDRWRALDPVAKEFLKVYFSLPTLNYNTEDEYLMTNELMAYLLQQPIERVQAYFGSLLPSRIYRNEPQHPALPERDASSGRWPVLETLFYEEAKAFNEYVALRWGLAGGRVQAATIYP